MYENVLNQLLGKFHIVKQDYLSCHSSFGIGGKATLIMPNNKKELIKSIKVLNKLGLKYQVLGNASNVLISSRNLKKIFILTKNMNPDFVLKKNSFTVSSGASLNQTILWCKEKGLSCLEMLYGIPATIGGAIVTNAGAFQVNVFDYLESVEVFNGKKVEKLEKSQIAHGYHYTELNNSNKIVISATFKFDRLAQSVINSKIKETIEQRKQKQPFEKSAGSVFKSANSVPAGLIIDNLNLKGLSVGDAQVSFKHANFIINKGNATSTDVKKLINLIKKIVKEKTNITLEREIEYIGD